MKPSWLQVVSPDMTPKQRPGTPIRLPAVRLALDLAVEHAEPHLLARRPKVRGCQTGIVDAVLEWGGWDIPHTCLPAYTEGFRAHCKEAKFPITRPAMLLLAAAQRQDDLGEPWGRALEKAAEVVRRKLWLQPRTAQRAIYLDGG